MSFNAAIDACGRAGQWRAALSLLDKMSSAGVPRGTITYNAVIAACGKGKEWARAVSLLHEMLARQAKTDGDLAPVPMADVVSYSAAIDACVRAGEWEEAIALVELLRRDRRLNVGTEGVRYCHPGARGPKHLTLTPEHLEWFATAFDRCDDSVLRRRALGLVDAMRVESEHKEL